MPPGMEDGDLRHILTEAADAPAPFYGELLAKLEAKFIAQRDPCASRPAKPPARCPTPPKPRIVVTNYRAWRHFIAMRAQRRARRRGKSGDWPSNACASSPPWPPQCSPTLR